MPRPAEPLIVDVEASGFGGHSYPIEIGLALEDGTKFCTLIAPAPDWTHWDESAEEVHRVSRDILETYGKPLDEVAGFLNAILAGKTVYTDGWVVDKPWLTRLFHAAGMDMDFEVTLPSVELPEVEWTFWTPDDAGETSG